MKIKLELDRRTDTEVMDLSTLIVKQMGDNAPIFTQPDPPLATLTTQAATMKSLMDQRAALLQKAQSLTVEIRDARNQLESSIATQSAYVEKLIKDLPDDQAEATAKKAGMDVADTPGGTIGALPKIEGLTATQGDASGEVDLSWNPIKRGLQNYLVELTEDPAAQTGWRFAMNSRKSNCSITGLTSGKRYWFRVTPEGSAGPGPASEAATKVAP